MKKGGRDLDCFACSKLMKKWAFQVESSDGNALTIHGQMQYVGSECYRKIRKCGSLGYQPPLGGPRLFDTLGPSCKVEIPAIAKAEAQT